MYNFFLALGLIFMLAACSGIDINGPCEALSSTEECVSDAICVDDGAQVCRPVCQSKDDCQIEEECNGITGINTKACYAKELTDTTKK